MKAINTLFRKRVASCKTKRTEWKQNQLSAFHVCFDLNSDIGGSIVLVRSPSGVLTPGGVSPKFAHNCLKTAWFWQHLEGRGRAPQGPLDPLVAPCTPSYCVSKLGLLRRQEIWRTKWSGKSQSCYKMLEKAEIKTKNTEVWSCMGTHKKQNLANIQVCHCHFSFRTFGAVEDIFMDIFGCFFPNGLIQ